MQGSLVNRRRSPASAAYAGGRALRGAAARIGHVGRGHRISCQALGAAACDREIAAGRKGLRRILVQ